MLREDMPRIAQPGAEWWQHAMSRMLRCQAIPDLLDLAYDAVRGGLGHGRVSVLLADQKARTLVERVCTDDTGCKVYPIDRVWPLDEGFYARVLADPSMQPEGAGFLTCADATYHWPHQPSDAAHDAGHKTLYVALRTPAAVLGLLAVDGTAESRTVNLDDAPPLVALAAPLALAIENATLRAQQAERLRAQQAERATAVELSHAAPTSVIGAHAATMAKTHPASASETRRASAETDALTGLISHRALLGQLDEAIATSGPFTMLLLDIDDFKLFNDIHGHAAGDRVLGEIATALRHICRDEDVAARFGGDEFAVLLRGASGAKARAVARRLESIIRAQPHVTPDGAVIPLTISTGLASCTPEVQSRRELIAMAETSLSAAKRGSRVPRRLRHTDLLDKSQVTVLNGLVIAVDAKDRYTREHSEEVTRGALLLAERVGLDAEERRILALAGPLHDVGKIAVPDRILRKPGGLTRQEYEIMQHHVAFGVAIVQGVLPDAAVVDAIAHHHERWDGAGYPYGLSGAQVPLLGRIMQIADAASAMRVNRPYRQGLPWTRIMGELRGGAGTQFDPDLVEPFIKAVGRVRA